MIPAPTSIRRRPTRAGSISKEKLSAVARSSAVFTIVPSVSIVIGLFTLSTVLGIPWPWYRLSVVGSVSYELMAADMVADGMGYGSVGEMAAQADHTVFGAVMFVMSICILAGIIINIFAVEKIDPAPHLRPAEGGARALLRPHPGLYG